MNRKEFIETLRRELSKLPQEEIDEAIEYYEEYFDEAGVEREEEVIKELGSPKKIANQIKSEYAVRQLDDEGDNRSTAIKGLSAVWWVILGICAAPVSIPIAIVLIALAIAGFALALSIVISVFAAIFSVAFTAVATIVLGILAIPSALSTAVLFIGTGLIVLGIMAGLMVLVSIGIKKLVSAMVKAIRRHNEKKRMERKCAA